MKIKDLNYLYEKWEKLKAPMKKNNLEYNSLEKNCDKYNDNDEFKHDYYKKKYYHWELNKNDNVWECDVPWQQEILAKPAEATKEDIEKAIQQQKIAAEKAKEKQLKEQREKERKLKEQQAKEQREKEEREQQLKEKEQAKRVEEIAATHITGDKLQELKEALIDEE